MNDEQSGTLLGIHWDRSALDLASIEPIGTDHALARLAARFTGVAWDSSKLDGLPFTLPEIASLAGGVTLGGHRVDNEQQAVALIKAQRRLSDDVAAGRFTFDSATSDRSNRILDVGAGRAVAVQPSTPRNLAKRLAELEIRHPVERAIVYFAFANRYPAYPRASAATARTMMNGLMMSNGFDAISVSGRRALEYNEALVHLFKDADATPIGTLLADIYRVEQGR